MPRQGDAFTELHAKYKRGGERAWKPNGVGVRGTCEQSSDGKRREREKKKSVIRYLSFKRCASSSFDVAEAVHAICIAYYALMPSFYTPAFPPFFPHEFKAWPLWGYFGQRFVPHIALHFLGNVFVPT